VLVFREIEAGALQRLLHVLLRSGVTTITAHGRRVPVAATPAADAAHAVTAAAAVPSPAVVGSVRWSRAGPYRTLSPEPQNVFRLCHWTVFRNRLDRSCIFFQISPVLKGKSGASPSGAPYIFRLA
jgi:hypothetical protein